MSELERLIQEHCPNGVEYKKLKEIAEMKRGTSVTKKDVTEGTIPVISGGREPAYYCDKYNREGETITVAGSGAGAGYVQYWTTPIFVCDAFSVKGLDFVQTKYLYYCLSNMQEDIYSTKKGGGVPHVHISSIENFKIPVPPVEVQGEIVRILDNFTGEINELLSKLALELDARKKQYAYYCRTALAFGDSTPIVKLEEVASYSKDRIAVDCLTENNYVGVENLLQNKAGKRNAEKVPTGTGNASGYRSDDILIGNIRPYLKKIWLADCDGGTNGDVLVIRSHNKSILTPQYLYCVLSSDDFFDYDTKNSKGAKMPRGDKAAVMQYEFSLPTVVEQQKAVEIINRLNIAYADICSELSAEIEARQKQYEYYRDKLLTFKEASE